MLSQHITNLFDWLISRGVDKNTLIMIFAAFGISVLMLVLGLLLALVKYLRKKKADKPAKPKKPKAPKNSKKTDESTSFKGPDPRFAIFKKREKKKARTEQAPQLAADQNVQALTDIERDMLALKELFDAGHIDASVYVEETRKLYDKAQQYI